MRIDKKSMMEVIHRERTFSDMFVADLLTRNIRYEEDLVDELFNSSEKHRHCTSAGEVLEVDDVRDNGIVSSDGGTAAHIVLQRS